jgi:tetratricopeptide (TPR) repeat protein
MGLSYFEDAVLHYTLALERSGDTLEKQRMYKRILLCFYISGQFDKAYAILKKSINVFTPDKDYHDYYYFGLTAMEAGKLTESRMLLKFAELTVPAHDVQWKKKIQEQLSRFIVE